MYKYLIEFEEFSLTMKFTITSNFRSVLFLRRFYVICRVNREALVPGYFFAEISPSRLIRILGPPQNDGITSLTQLR